MAKLISPTPLLVLIFCIIPSPIKCFLELAGTPEQEQQPEEENDPNLFVPFSWVADSRKMAFTLNAYEYGRINANEPFTFSSIKRVQYFEVMLMAIGSNIDPIKLGLKGAESSHHFVYHPHNLEVNDRIGIGIIHHNNGKFYHFNTRNDQISQIRDLTPYRHTLGNGLIPTVDLYGRGTQISMPRVNTEAFIAELERWILRYEQGTQQRRQPHSEAASAAGASSSSSQQGPFGGHFVLKRK